MLRNWLKKMEQVTSAFLLLRIILLRLLTAQKKKWLWPLLKQKLNQIWSQLLPRVWFSNKAQNLRVKLILEISVAEIWTSGIIDKTLTPCAGDLTINWCSSNLTQIISPWWQGKVSGLDESAISKGVSLKDSALKVSAVDAALPFFCKVR